MSNKQYAVYQGFHPGIYDNWEQAKREVTGFSNAVYKSFNTYDEAYDWMENNVSMSQKMKLQVSPKVTKYMNTHHKETSESYYEEPEVVQEPDSECTIKLYTDGSYDKYTKRYAWAYVLISNDNRLVDFDAGAESASDDNMWQVSGEIQAVIEGLTYAHANGVKQIIVNYDLINLQKWGDDQWRAKKPETQAYKEAIKKFRAEGMVISFNKIKSHSGSEYNEMCDYLAKQALGFYKTDNMDAISADHYKMMQEALS